MRCYEFNFICLSATHCLAVCQSKKSIIEIYVLTNQTQLNPIKSIIFARYNLHFLRKKAFVLLLLVTYPPRACEA